MAGRTDPRITRTVRALEQAIVELASQRQHSRAGRARFAAQLAGVGQGNPDACLRKTPCDGSADETRAHNEDVHASYIVIQ